MKVLSALFVALFAAGCAAAPTGPLGPGDKLYQAVSMRSSQLVSVIDTRSHRVERRLPLGAPSPDWKHLYSFDTTSVVDTDPLTGQTQAALQLGHAYRLPDATAWGMPGGTSPNGKWLVLERYDLSADVPSASHLLILNTTPLQAVRRVDLAGFFNFDAISDDGMNLYLIQYLNGKEYYVRLYDLATGVLTDNIVVDKSDGNQSMAGLRLSGIARPDGAWLLSMYVREHDAPFIHALSLQGPFAFCLDLPGKGFADDGTAMQWSLAMTRDGRRFYAVNLATGDIAVVGFNDSGPEILKTAHLARTTAFRGLVPSVYAKEMSTSAAVVSDDGKTLVAGGPTGVVWIDTKTLSIRNRALGDWRVSSLGVSPDGRTVYAVSDVGRIAMLSMASGAVGATFELGGGQPMALMRVASA